MEDESEDEIVFDDDDFDENKRGIKKQGEQWNELDLDGLGRQALIQREQSWESMGKLVGLDDEKLDTKFHKNLAKIIRGQFPVK
ncbi:MAG: hypothetical protein EZS28_015401 [Streblomastix strix]|uniref:Uncharacterized protein n=1 Tax=Streblomastix strix TaxID=222440 RepID=A0A5J4W338_9EUKA|nr:MAG: hypothetical protein EZS28_015401 [Streblomastix strix]